MKRIKTLLSLVLIFTMCFTLSACGSKDEMSIDTITDDSHEISTESLLRIPYTEEELNSYLTLPDYEEYEVISVTPEKVTDEKVDEKISQLLLAKGTTEEITTGKAEEGDRINLSFTGKLEDGSTVDGLNSNSLSITLGAENMVEGFQEAIIGKPIGEQFTMELSFPENYETLEEISGHTVTFDMKINYKSIITPAVLDDDFVKANSDVNTVDEYKQYVRSQLEKSAEELAHEKEKESIYSQIQSATEMHEIPAERVTQYREATIERYQNVAKEKGYEWTDFIDKVFGISEDDFDIQMTQYSNEMVKQEMIIYAIAYREKIEITNEEFEDYMNEQLQNSGYSSMEEFEAAAGMSYKEYVANNHLALNIYLGKELTQIYERLSK